MALIQKVRGWLLPINLILLMLFISLQAFDRLYFQEQIQRVEKTYQEMKARLDQSQKQVDALEKAAGGFKEFFTPLKGNHSEKELLLLLNRELSGLPGIKVKSVRQIRRLNDLKLFQAQIELKGNVPLLAGILRRLPPYLNLLKVQAEAEKPFVLKCLVVERMPA